MPHTSWFAALRANYHQVRGAYASFFLNDTTLWSLLRGACMTFDDVDVLDYHLLGIRKYLQYFALLFSELARDDQGNIILMYV